METFIGIDLGTTYSCVGVFRNNSVDIIADDHGNHTMPSYVGFFDEGRHVGEAAKNQECIYPASVVFDSKRFIGRKFSDPIVQKDIPSWPFTILDGGVDNPEIVIEWKDKKERFSPIQISAMILEKIKETAESYLGKKVDGAVLTIPAHFNDAQRQSTLDAGKIAGLRILQLINEPTAAAVAYGLGHVESKMKTALVFDLGGGTFDVSLLSIKGSDFVVKATGGNSHLGGRDFDRRLVDHCVSEFQKKHKLDISGLHKPLGRLRVACDRAKRCLTSAAQTSISVECLYKGIDFQLQITRAKFEELCQDLFLSTITVIKQVLADAHIAKGAVDEIILVGGSSRIPKVQQLISKFFDGKEPTKSINPDQAVAHGAALYASRITSSPSDLCRDILLKDVVPLSLGIGIINGMTSVVIPRNTSIPVSHTKTFTNSLDDQEYISIKVFEGEFEDASKNSFLGRFDLHNIKKSPAYNTKVEVTFDVDVNGILKVSALDSTTRSKAEITISKDRGHCSENDIAFMVAEADRIAQINNNAVARLASFDQLNNTIDEVNELLSVEDDNPLTATFKILLNEIISRLQCWIADHPTATKNEFDLEIDVLSAQKALYEQRFSMEPNFSKSRLISCLELCRTSRTHNSPNTPIVLSSCDNSDDSDIEVIDCKDPPRSRKRALENDSDDDFSASNSSQTFQ